MVYKEFHELDVWKDSYTLLMKVYDITDEFPAEERYALTSQIRRSANSVIANMAEAHGRYNFADKVRVLYIARGEIVETRSHLAVAYGQKYISKDVFSLLNNRYKQLTIDLNKYILNLKDK